MPLPFALPASGPLLMLEIPSVKICDLTQFYSPRSGGVKRYITEKRRHIQAHTQDEHFLIIPGERTEHVQEGRLHTLTVQSPRIDKTSRYRALLNTRAVSDWLDEFRPDVIETGDPYQLAWTGLRSGRELKIPIVGYYHSHFPEAYLRTALKYGGSRIRNMVMDYAQDYITRLYSQFNRTLVPSDHLRDLLLGWGVSNAVTVRLGVDTESFTPGPPDSALRQELDIPEDAFLLLYVGRLSGEKNISTLLEAFEILRSQSGTPYWLLIIGDGPLRRLLPGVTERTGAVRWKSYVADNAELARHYRAADLFVHPGVCETFGLVALESQACGCPVAGIHGSYMDANIFAGLDFWARENSPAALADTIGAMADLNLPQLGREAAETVASRFAWPKVFDNLWHYYKDAIHQGAPPKAK